MNERDVMLALDHPFILKLAATFKDQNCLYMLLELVQGGELFTFLGNAPNERVDCGSTALRRLRTCREARSNQRGIPARRGRACLDCSVSPPNSCAPAGHPLDTKPALHDCWRPTLAP